MIAGLIFAAAVATLPEAGWSYRDYDLGRVYEAKDGSGNVVLVASVYSSVDSLVAWFTPRAEALAGFGVEAQIVGEKRARAKIVREVQLAAQAAPLLMVSVSAYETPAGMQIIMIANPEGKRSAEAMAFVADHMKAGDVWMGTVWQEPIVTPLETGLSCRMEQVPSLVWTFERDCTGGACRLEPGVATKPMVQTVCR